MKTPFDPRHQRRIHLMQSLFTNSFPGGVPEKEVREIIGQTPVLDEKIQTAAPEWPVDKIAKIDLAILRLAAYELLIEKKEPRATRIFGPLPRELREKGFETIFSMAEEIV